MLLGMHHSKESIQKMSDSNKGRAGYWLGKQRSDETRQNISKAKKGSHQNLSEQQRQILSQRMKGNKYATGNKNSLGYCPSEETRKKMSLAKIGVPRSEEAKKILSQCKLGNKNRFGTHQSDKFKQQVSQRWKGNQYAKGNKYHLGKHPSEETNQKNREAHLGEKSWSWLGGISFEPYAKEFNRQLKGLIRDRDNHICQRCGIPEMELTKHLTIHHIDYNKKNCLPSNLVALCNSCNSKVNNNRNYWIGYFTDLLHGDINE